MSRFMTMLQTLWKRGFLQGFLLPLAWILPVHGVSFTFHESRIDQLLWGHPGGLGHHGDLEALPALGLALGAGLVLTLLSELGLRWFRAGRGEGEAPDQAVLGLLAGLAAYVPMRQIGGFREALEAGREPGLLAMALRSLLACGILSWCLRRSIRAQEGTGNEGRFLSSGFLEGAALSFLLLLGGWILWFRFGDGTLDSLALGAGDRRWWWWRMTHVGPRGIALRVACTALVLPLAVRAVQLRRRGLGRRFLSGAAAGGLLYLGISQLGPAMRVWELGLTWRWLEGMRLGFSWYGALLLLRHSLQDPQEGGGFRRRLHIGGVALCGFLALGLEPLAAAAVDHEAWRDARLDGSLGAMARYVRAHPGTSRLPEIRRLAWKRAREARSVGPVQDYLLHARAWGDRMDSARQLEADWFRRIRARSLRSSYSQDSLVDRFWRERLPDSLGPYRGSRIVRYRLVLDTAGFAAQASALGRKWGRIVAVPSEAFDPWGEDFPVRLASALDSAVHPWAGPSLLTIAPWRDVSRSPDFEIRVHPRAAAPLEPVPCSPGCPLDSSQRQALPAIAYRLETVFHLKDGRTHRLATELLDTNFGYSPSPEEDVANDSRAGAWENLDLPGAWARRRENSLQGLEGAFRDIWKERGSVSGR